MIDRKQLILVIVPGQGSAIFDRSDSDWAMVCRSDGPIEAMGNIVELELSSGSRAGCYGELPEDWDWDDLTEYLRRRFTIPSEWTESGEAMIVPPGEKQTVESKTYDTPEGERAIDALGNHYRIDIVGDGEIVFVAILNENLTKPGE